MQKSEIKRSHLYLKKERNHRLKFFLILTVLIPLAIMYIWQRVTVLTLANEIKRLNVQIENQQKEYKYLQVEVAELGSVERIERMAEEMGFIYPSFEQVKLLPESQDSAILEKLSPVEDIWIKFKGISP